ncbi:MAG: rod shape-determining protein MreC [Fibrobacterota bacterium]
MHWLISFIVEHKSGSSLFVTVLVSLLLINAGKTEQEQISKTITSLLFPAEVLINNTQKIRNVFTENRRLHEQITALQLENAHLKQTLTIDSVEKSLRKSRGREYQTVMAEVVAYEPVSIQKTIIINAGQNQGVAENMPVIGPEGIVGKVSMVLPNSARVQLILMPDEKISISHPGSDAVGILRSTDGRSLKVNISAHRTVQRGDTILTSGLGGVYPPNLPVGAVEKIETGINPLYNAMTITPFENLNKLRLVSVITTEERWSPYGTSAESVTDSSGGKDTVQ